MNNKPCSVIGCVGIALFPHMYCEIHKWRSLIDRMVEIPQAAVAVDPAGELAKLTSDPARTESSSLSDLESQ